jgi:hypothetical protein
MLGLLSIALAAELVPVSTVPTNFPGGGLDVGLERVHCEARASVAADGTVQAVQVPRTEICPDVFAAAVEHAVSQYRYPPGDPEREARAQETWRLKSSAFPTMTPAEMGRILEAHEVIALDVPHCELRLRITPDGAIASLRTSELPRCAVMPLGPARNPARLRRQETKPVQCTARFTSDRGVASDVSLDDCPRSWRTAADVALRNWVWQSGPELYEDYVVRFVFLLESE